MTTTICTDVAVFVLHVDPGSCSLDFRRPDLTQSHRTSHTEILQGLTKSSSSLVDRWNLSILTRGHTLALFCRLRAGMHARPANATAHQPPHHARCTPPRLLTCRSCSFAAKHFPIASDTCRHCATWLTLSVTIGSVIQGCCRRFASNMLAHPHDPRFTAQTADRQGMIPSWQGSFKLTLPLHRSARDVAQPRTAGPILRAARLTVPT